MKDGKRALKTGLAAFLLLLAATATAEGNGLPFGPAERERPSFGIYAAEAGGAIVGTLALGLCGVGLAYGYAGNNSERVGGAMAILSVTPLLAVVGCAGGTCIVGDAVQQGGRFLPTLAYAAGSAALGAGLYAGGMKVAYGGIIRDYDVAQWVGWGIASLGVGTIAATPLVAVYGYNRSRPRDALGDRFLPGSIGLRPERNPDGTMHASLDLRLLSIGF